MVAKHSALILGTKMRGLHSDKFRDELRILRNEELSDLYSFIASDRALTKALWVGHVTGTEN
jgi:hypothetical protein